MLAAVTVSFLAATTLGGFFLVRQLRQDAGTRLLSAGQRLRDGFHADVTRHEAALRTLAARRDLQPGALAAALEGHPAFLALLVTGPDGRICQLYCPAAATAPPLPGENTSVAALDYFRQPQQTLKPFLSNALADADARRPPAVALSVPLIDASGRFAGVVAGLLDPRRLPALAAVSADAPAVRLHDARGAVVASAGARAAPGPELRLPLAGGGWSLAVRQPSGPFPAPLGGFLLAVALLLLLSGAAAWWAGRRMAGALSAPLADLARRIRQYDPAAPVEPPGEAMGSAGELAAVLDAFRHLAQRLAADHRRSRGLLADLETQLSDSASRLANSESRYFQLLSRTSDISYSTGPTGLLTSWNEAFERLLGPVPPGAKIQHWLDRPNRHLLQRAAIGQIRNRTDAAEVEVAVTLPGGESRWLAQISRLLLDPRSGVIGFQVVAEDITERRLARTAQREAEERYALAVRGSKNGIWDWDLRTGTVYYSPRWREMLGIPPGAPCETPEAWLTRVHPGDVRSLQADLNSFLRQDGIEIFESEHRIQHGDGTWRWVMTCGAAVRGADGRALRIAGSASDLTAGKLVDPLTGLPNRLAALERLEQLLGRQREDPNRPFALLFMDLDRFKMVNDSLGHVKGDHLLLGVSRRLMAALDQVDGAVGFVGRLGGDEFVVVLDDAPGGRIAVAVAQAVQREMQAPFSLDGSLLFASTSIGIAISEPSQTSAEDLLRNADTAMYHAKSAGRGRYRIFDSSMRATAIARLALETDLRRALDDGEFELFYQAQVDLATGRLSGFEALVRWQHPTRGLLPPSQFIYAAEENGLILPLGRWVLEQGCRQLAAWQSRLPACGGLSVSINLSALQFNDPKLATVVASVLAETGLDPHRLHLEVTETMLAADPGVARSTLEELSAMGVALEVDDFGTGYSCLGQLHQLPFNTVKVDRTFVQAMDSQQKSQNEGRKIVESIVNLSGNLGISVIAEGIENEDHWVLLARLGCNIGQGYYFSRPVDSEAAFELATRRLSQPWPVPASLCADPAALLQLERSLRGATPTRPTPPQ